MASDSLHGMITCGTGGLYTVLLDGGKTLKCKARGVFRIKNITPLAGDTVSVRRGERDEKGYFIEKIDERKTVFARPPMANVDTVFVTVAADEPAPNLFYTDKLLCSVSDAGATPVVIITKTDVSPEKAKELKKIYSAGYTVFLTSSSSPETAAPILEYIKTNTHICAFAGASGVGKSTLINTLFPSLTMKTGEISEKSQRGKHTTRTVTLFDNALGGFIADTPGFTMLDLDDFDIKRSDRLFFMFPEFEKYFGKCKYRGCTHIKEEGCEIISAVERKEIAPSRHESYATLFLKEKQKH